MTRLVAVAGACPGAGKSTLCAGIADWLRARGLRVDHLKEEEVLTREAFVPLAGEFTATGEVQLSTLLETTEAYLADAEQQGVDVAVTDALVPFVPSLIGWGYSEAESSAFLTELADRIAETDPVAVYLNDDPTTAVPRAVAREGPSWQDWLLTKLGQYPVEPPIHDLNTACNYLRYERDVTLRLLAHLPWELIVLEQTGPPSPDGVSRRPRTNGGLTDRVGTSENIRFSIGYWPNVYLRLALISWFRSLLRSRNSRGIRAVQGQYVR